MAFLQNLKNKNDNKLGSIKTADDLMKLYLINNTSACDFICDFLDNKLAIDITYKEAVNIAAELNKCCD